MKQITLNTKNIKITKTDENILIFLNNNLHKIPALKLIDIAKATNSSIASISRLCNKLGYDGYLGLRMHFKEYYSPDLEIKNSVVKTHIQKLYELDKIDQWDEILKVVKSIENAGQIIFIGEGESYLICRIATAILNSKKYINVKYSYPSTFDEEIYKVNNTHTFIFYISFSGENKAILDVANKLKSQCKSASITNLSNNSLSSLTTFKLHSPLVSDYFMYSAPASLATRYCLIDMVLKQVKSK